MCTALALKSIQNENFFGRTMDFTYDIDPSFYVIPKGYSWQNIYSKEWYVNDYSFIGIGQESEGILGFFDGVNECGFAAAALYFAGYANYNPPLEDGIKKPIPSLDFLHYLLGHCSCLEDLKNLLKDKYIIGIPDPITKIAAPLHWFVTDQSGKCLVIEQTGKGLEIIDNPIGVLANSPDFNWHITNLRNYMEISDKQKNEVFWGNMKLTPFGQAGGTTLLPGGYSSPERFVRTSFLKTHSLLANNRAEAIVTCFQLLGNVTIPKGVVLSDKESYDYTKYTAFINTNTCEYYFNTYKNSQITTVSLEKNLRNTKSPIHIGRIIRPILFESF